LRYPGGWETATRPMPHGRSLLIPQREVEIGSSRVTPVRPPDF
jgi:hypothetical protein